MALFAFIPVLYYVILAGWTFLFFRVMPYHYPLLGFLAAGFLFQLWLDYRKRTPWAGHLAAYLQLIPLFPLLIYGDFSYFPLFFSMLPCFSIGRLYGIFWGAFTLVPAAAAAFLGAWMRGVPENAWILLGFSGCFELVSFFALFPLIGLNKEAAREFEVAQGLARLFEGRPDMRAVLEWLVEKAVALCGVEFAAIYVLDPKQGKLSLHGAAGEVFDTIKEDLLELATGTLEWVVKEGKMYVANDLSLDPRYAHYRKGKPSVSSLACVPVGRTSEIEGVFVCGSTLVPPSPTAKPELLIFFARYISLILEAESRRQVHRRVLREMDALHACCSALTSGLGLEEFLHLIAGFTQQILDVKEWTLFLFDPKKKEFYGYLSTTAFMEEIQGLKLSWGEGAISQAVIRKEPMMIPDLSKNPLVSEKENRNGQFLSMLVLPLFKEESILGAIQAGDTVPRSFSDEEIRFASSLASLAAILLSRSLPPVTQNRLPL